MNFLIRHSEQILLKLLVVLVAVWLSFVLAACGKQKQSDGAIKSSSSQDSSGQDRSGSVSPAITDRPAEEFLNESGTESTESDTGSHLNAEATLPPTPSTTAPTPSLTAMEREHALMAPFLRAFDRTEVSCYDGARQVDCSRSPYVSAGVFHWISVERSRLVARRCTGFLVAPDLLMTAAHCIPASLRPGPSERVNTVGCSTRFSIVFPALNRRGQKEIHRCREIVTASTLPAQGSFESFKTPDYALIRLAESSRRPVLQVDPLRSGRDGDTIRAMVADFSSIVNSPVASMESSSTESLTGVPQWTAKLKALNCKLVRGSLFSVGKRNEFNSIEVMGNCQIKSGMSGAPILNTRGRAIGIVKQTVSVSDVDAPTAQWLRRVLHARQRVAHLARYTSMGCFSRNVLNTAGLASFNETEMALPQACGMNQNQVQGQGENGSVPSNQFVWHRLSQYQDQMSHIESRIAREEAQWVERYSQNLRFNLQPIRWMEAEEASVDPVVVREEVDPSDAHDENYFIYYAMLMPYQTIDPIEPTCRKVDPMPQRWFRGASGRTASLAIPTWRTYTYVDRYLRPRLTTMKVNRSYSRRAADGLPLCPQAAVSQ